MSRKWWCFLLLLFFLCWSCLTSSSFYLVFLLSAKGQDGKDVEKVSQLASANIPEHQFRQLPRSHRQSAASESEPGSAALDYLARKQNCESKSRRRSWSWSRLFDCATLLVVYCLFAGALSPWTRTTTGRWWHGSWGTVGGRALRCLGRAPGDCEGRSGAFWFTWWLEESWLVQLVYQLENVTLVKGFKRMEKTIRIVRVWS